MTDTKTPDPLRDPAFLLGLGRFTGEWTTPRRTLHVDRRPDGWLSAHVAESSVHASLTTVLRDGTWQSPPPSPLGFYPVVLSQSLVSLWLSPEEQSRFRYAWAVREGQRILLETIERRIAELPESDRNARWLAWWNHHEPGPLTRADRRAHAQLLTYGDRHEFLLGACPSFPGSRGPRPRR